MKTVRPLLQSVRVFTDTFWYLQKSKNPRVCTEDLKRQWARDILFRMKVKLELVGTPSLEDSVLFVGNHISYLDIPVLLHSTKSLSFVAKEQISSWPLIGQGAKRINTVFVAREKGASRKSAKDSVHKALDGGARVVIFPSGTTCLSERKDWKKGSFEIAYARNGYIQPFRISYNPLRAAAYIDEDIFLPHLFKLSKLDRIQAKIEFHEPVKIKDPVEDCNYWNRWSREHLK